MRTDKLGEIVNKDNERYIQIETFASISNDWGEEINISKINLNVSCMIIKPLIQFLPKVI